ncbi:hypothetical protein INR49_004211 [Caranx melampygus]|nr:hypothetical protein INR49_004211 [Caranx melampygus]
MLLLRPLPLLPTAVLLSRESRDAASYDEGGSEGHGPWLGGQPVYGPMSNASSQMNPLLYSGSVSGKSIPLKPMPLPPPQSSAYSMPAPSMHGNHTPATNRMLDYMESQVRGMDMASPLLQSQPPPPQHMQQMPPPVQHMPINVPFSPGPPSMISALDDGPAERRLITLPPIREQNMGRMPPLLPKLAPRAPAKAAAAASAAVTTAGVTLADQIQRDASQLQPGLSGRTESQWGERRHGPPPLPVQGRPVRQQVQSKLLPPCTTPPETRLLGLGR